MAEICAILQCVTPVIELLTPLTHEVLLLKNLAKEVQKMKPELSSISAFLETAEERSKKDATVTAWVKDVITLAYEIEDVIEEYNLHQIKNARHRIGDVVKFRVHDIAKRIKSIQEKAKAVDGRRRNYCSNESVTGHQSEDSNGSSSSSSSTRHHVSETFELVGAAAPKTEIIDLLGLEEQDSPLSVVAVLGARGLGKTTIVESVYEDQQVKDFFPSRAWIHVPQPYKMIDILRSMIVQFQELARELQKRLRAGSESNHLEDTPDDSIFHPITEYMDERALETRIKNYLNDKRYMIVFDNVQEGNKDLVAHVVKQVLPATNCDHKGSKLMVMTRSENVARAVQQLQGTSHALYELKPLPANKAWELFCTKTFEDGAGTCPSNLEKLAHEFVDICQGIPSKILVIGSALSSRQNDLRQWQNVHQNLDFYLRDSFHLLEPRRDANLKYAALPFHLKPCFLYFGMFPKDSDLSPRRLVRLWVAEGFIPVPGGIKLTLEETAEEYLYDLIRKGFVKFKSPDIAGNPQTTLRVADDFLWEVIVSRLKELKFCQVLSNQVVVPDDNPPRRLCIHKDRQTSDEDKVLMSITRVKCSIRSLISLTRFTNALTESLFKNLHLLKVLALCDPEIDSLPGEVGELQNLRYLSLSHTQLRVLPKSIGKLHYLQTLELKQTLIQELPIEINSLFKLRHLLVYRYEYDPLFSFHVWKTIGVKILELGNLTELQKLAFLDVSHETYDTKVVKELGNLTQLRKLGIKGLRPKDEPDLCLAITRMKCLESLSMYWESTTRSMVLETITCPLLKQLDLNGGLKHIPSWIFKLQNLVKIRLRWSRLRVDPLEALQELHNLVEIQLLEAYEGASMRVTNGGFPKLKKLELMDLRKLKSLDISQGALPLLETMSIGESQMLQVPTGIRYVTNLRELKFYNMPSSFTNCKEMYETINESFDQPPNLLVYVKGHIGWVLDTSRSTS